LNSHRQPRAKLTNLYPGGKWLDTAGNFINAHAGGITVDHTSGKFYWFGERKTEEQPEGGGVSVYSSSDLGTWEYQGIALGEY
jgi:hypothetical protein